MAIPWVAPDFTHRPCIGHLLQTYPYLPVAAAEALSFSSNLTVRRCLVVSVGCAGWDFGLLCGGTGLRVVVSEVVVVGTRERSLLRTSVEVAWFFSCLASLAAYFYEPLPARPSASLSPRGAHRSPLRRPQAGKRTFGLGLGGAAPNPLFAVSV